VSTSLCNTRRFTITNALCVQRSERGRETQREEKKEIRFYPEHTTSLCSQQFPLSFSSPDYVMHSKVDILASEGMYI
jgi:hypothetical protein